nr:uncharacterized protein LOC124816405 isoform X1 [Hydra vulgaris]
MLTLFYRILYIYLSIYLSLVSGGSIAGRIVFYILYILYGEIYAIASSVSNENGEIPYHSNITKIIAPNTRDLSQRGPSINGNVMGVWMSPPLNGGLIHTGVLGDTEKKTATKRL